MFTYYKAITCKEHMLYAKEIAQLYTYKGKKFTSQKIAIIIGGYLKANCIEYESLYFETRHGLCKVYPFEIYDPAMKWYFEKLDNKNKE